MFVFPARVGVPLPEVFQQWAAQPAGRCRCRLTRSTRGAPTGWTSGPRWSCGEPIDDPRPSAGTRRDGGPGATSSAPSACRDAARASARRLPRRLLRGPAADDPGSWAVGGLARCSARLRHLGGHRLHSWPSHRVHAAHVAGRPADGIRVAPLRVPRPTSLLALVTVPFVLPTVVVGLAFRVLLPGELVGTTWAVLLAHVFFNVAVVVRVVGGLWAHIDPALRQVSRALRRVVDRAGAPDLAVAAAGRSGCVVGSGAAVQRSRPSASFSSVRVRIAADRRVRRSQRRATRLLDLSGAAALAILPAGARSRWLLFLVVSHRSSRRARLAVRRPVALPGRRRPGSDRPSAPVSMCSFAGWSARKRPC